MIILTKVISVLDIEEKKDSDSQLCKSEELQATFASASVASKWCSTMCNS